MKIVGAAAIAIGFALSCSLFVSSPALAQPSIEVGPGGVRSIRIQIGMNVGGADGTVTGRGAAER